MFLGRGVPLVIEIMQQGSGGIKPKHCLALWPTQAEPIGLGFTVGNHAGLHGQRVLAQAFALGPLGEQGPRLVSVESFLIAQSLFRLQVYQCGSFFPRFVRQLWGILLFDYEVVLDNYGSLPRQ